jgi:hypothetical protein
MSGAKRRLQLCMVQLRISTIKFAIDNSRVSYFYFWGSTTKRGSQYGWIAYIYRLYFPLLWTRIILNGVFCDVQPIISQAFRYIGSFYLSTPDLLHTTVLSYIKNDVSVVYLYRFCGLIDAESHSTIHRATPCLPSSTVRFQYVLVKAIF